jgi:protein TonB
VALVAALAVNAGLAVALAGLDRFGQRPLPPARPGVAPIEVAWVKPPEPREPEPEPMPRLDRTAKPPEEVLPPAPEPPSAVLETPPPLSLEVTLDLPDLPPLLVDPSASIESLDLSVLTVRRPARAAGPRPESSRGPMNELGVDVPPRKRYWPAPAFPRRAMRRHIAGWVNAKLLVTRTGRVAEVKIVSSSPRGHFDRAVKRAVRSWVFTPARYRGETVECWCRQTFEFRLEDR